MKQEMTGWSCISSCGCLCLELTAVFRQRSTVTGSLSTTTEDSTFYGRRM